MKINEIAGEEGLGLLRSILGPLRLEPGAHEAMLATFRRELEEVGDNRIICVGEVDGETVATVQLILKDADGDPELADGRTIAHVHHLRVRQNRQGKGFARRIMADVESRAKALGFGTLTLGVDDTNGVARELYRSLGYVEFKAEAGRSPGETLLLLRKSTLTT